MMMNFIHTGERLTYCSFISVVHAGSLSERMANRPPPKVIEFVEPGRQRKEKKAIPPVCTDLRM